MLSGKKFSYLRLFMTLLVIFILFRVVNNTELIFQSLKYFFSITSYFIWGFAIAYLLNPLMVFIERRFNLKRIWSLLIIYSVFIGMIVFSIIIITPIVMGNIRELLEHIPTFIIQAQTAIEQYITQIELLHDYNLVAYFENNLNDILDQINNILRTPFVENNVGEIIERINRIFSQTINIVFIQAISITTAILRLIFGIILSIYMLKDKEAFIRNIKRLLYALVSKDRANYVLELSTKTNKIFSQYLVGKTLDSLIIGFLCYIALLIFRVPYPLIISLIVAITNMIPYFGPFIGMIPAFVITIFFSPLKAVIAVIIIIILQQLDGWFIGPKILGDSVGMNPFWIIVAIVIGGGMFGIMGMLVGVPVLAVIKLLIEEFIQKRLKAKEVHIV